MSTVRFVIGIGSLAAIAGSAAVSSWLVVRTLPPRSRPVGVLATIVVALGVVIGTAELLGTVGLFRLVPLVIGTVVVSAALVVLARRFPSPEVKAYRDADEANDTPPRWHLAATAVTVSSVVVRWVSATLHSLMNGIVDYDSRHYHLSFAAEFTRTGWVTRFQPIWPDPVHTFYPANSELAQGMGMVAMGRDVLAPLANLGWLALLLLAAWCAGERAGLAIQTLLVAAWVAGIPLFTYTNSGTALSDVAAIALLVAAIALWVASEGDLRWLAVAGLALGLGVGTKLTVAPVATLLVLAIVLSVAPARRLGALATVVGSAAVGCGFWFVRNLIRAGSPLPSLALPFLPSTDLPIVDRFGFSVAHYATDSDVVRSVYWPGLRLFFGWGGLAAATGAAFSVPALVHRRIRRGNRLPALLVACGLLGLAAYTVTPAGAWGAEGAPDLGLFYANLRYALPSVIVLGLGLAIATGRGRARHRTLFVAALAVATTIEALRPGRVPIPNRYALAAAMAVAVVGGVVVTWARLSGTGVRRRCALAAILLVAVVVVGPPLSRRQLSHRTEGANPAAAAVHRWATSIDGARIGYYAFEAIYPMYGPGWENELIYIGVAGPHQGFRAVADCPEYVRTLAHQRFQYVVLGPPSFFHQELDLVGWTRDQEGTREVLSSPPYTVFEVTDPYDPSRCVAD